MARRGGIEAFFDALEALTYREMRQVASLLSLQIDGETSPDEARVAEALADAAESFADADED